MSSLLRSFDNIVLKSFVQLDEIVREAADAHAQIFIILRLFLRTNQILLGNVGQLKMYAAVLKVGSEEIHGFFKILIVFDESFVEHHIGHGCTATDTRGIGLCNRIQKRGKPLAIVSAALTAAEFQRIAAKSAIGRCKRLLAEPLMMRMVADQIADEEMIAE